MEYKSLIGAGCLVFMLFLIANFMWTNNGNTTVLCDCRYKQQPQKNSNPDVIVTGKVSEKVNGDQGDDETYSYDHNDDENSLKMEEAEVQPKDDEVEPSFVREKKKVFIDLGANMGDSILSFATGRTKALGGNALHGKGKSGGWEIWAFEANPHFDEDLVRAKQTILNENKNFTVFLYNSSAIWIEDGSITFYLDVVNKGKSFWGSSLNSDHPAARKSEKMNITVPCYDLAKLITTHYTPEDYVVVKMDIESVEYVMLRHLLVKGVVPYIDELIVEFHYFGKGSPYLGALKWIFEESNVKLVHWG